MSSHLHAVTGVSSLLHLDFCLGVEGEAKTISMFGSCR